MPEYRRSFIPGGTFFFTVVTFHRCPILTRKDARDILHRAWADVQGRFPFTTDAICVLPDHMHCIWTLPEDDTDYSIRWREIKRLFSKEYGRIHDIEVTLNTSRVKRNERTFWQRRFWEHTIWNEQDFEHHFDYIHFNPVKHGLVQRVRDWQWSSFHRYVRQDVYDINWGGVDEKAFPVSCGE